MNKNKFLNNKKMQPKNKISFQDSLLNSLRSSLHTYSISQKQFNNKKGQTVQLVLSISQKMKLEPGETIFSTPLTKSLSLSFL